MNHLEAVTSFYELPCLWTPSPTRLGRHSDRAPIRRSGLWNVNFAFDSLDVGVLDIIERYVRQA